MVNKAQVFNYDIIDEINQLLAEVENNLVECRQLINDTQKLNAEISGLQLKVKRDIKNRKQVQNAINEIYKENNFRIA